MCPVQNVTYVSGRSAEIQASKKWLRVTPGVTAALSCSQVLLPRMGCESVYDWGFDSGRALYVHRSEEHTSELQSLMRNSYAVFCLKKNNNTNTMTTSV